MCSVQWHLGLEVCGLSWQFLSKVYVYLTDSRWMQSWNVGHRRERGGGKKGWVLHCTVRPTRHVTLFIPVAFFELVSELWKCVTSLWGWRLMLRVTISSIFSLALQGHYGRCCSERVPRSSLMLSPHTAVNLYLMFLFSPDLQEERISEDTTLQYFLRNKKRQEQKKGEKTNSQAKAAETPQFLDNILMLSNMLS